MDVEDVPDVGASSITTSRSRTIARRNWTPCSMACRTIKVSWGEFGSKYEGLVERFTRMYIKKDAAAMSDRNRAIFEQFVTSQICPVCHGGRLNEAALNCRINGKNIAELSDLEATELIAFLEGFTDPVAKRLGRPAHRAAGPSGRYRARLSESQPGNLDPVRRRVAADQDDPPPRQQPDRYALHPRRAERGAARARRRAAEWSACKKLRDKGNTVLVVEHDPDVIAIADHGWSTSARSAGTHGGEVVFAGSYDGSQTGRYPDRAVLATGTCRSRSGCGGRPAT